MSAIKVKTSKAFIEALNSYELCSYPRMNTGLDYYKITSAFA